MKVSVYNIYFDKNCIVYNTLYRNILFLDNRVYRILKEKNKGEILTNQELTSLNSEYLQKLKDNRIIVADNIIENPCECQKHFDYYINDKILYVKLLTTLDCNLACPYCYENNKTFNRSKQAKQVNTNLTIKNADSIIQFLEEYAKKNKIRKFHLAWYGGEPLLNFKIIKYISKKLITFCRKESIDYYSDVSTNGVLLYKKKIIRILKKSKVSLIGITIDGDEDSHNRMRPSVNYDKNALYHSIINNIDNLIDDFHFMIRIMVNRNTKNCIDRVLEDFSKIHNKANLTFYVGGLEDIEGCLANKTMLKEAALNNIEVTQIRSTFFYLCSKFGLQAVPETGPLPNPICSALKPSTFVISPDLSVYKCPDGIGIEKHKFGYIKGKGIFEYIPNKEYLNFEIQKPCIDCRMLPICNGGCMFRRLQTNKIECVFKTLDGIKVDNKEILEEAIHSYVYAHQKGLVPYKDDHKRFYNVDR